MSIKHTDEIIQKVVDLQRADVESREGDDIAMPIFHIGKEGHMEIVAAHWGPDPREREMCAKMVRARAAKIEATWVLFACESYGLKDQEAAQDFMKNRKKYPTVSDHPKAIDIMMFQLETHEENWTGIASIDKKVNPHKMGDVVWTKMDGMSGRMANLLPPLGFTAGLKKL